MSMMMRSLAASGFALAAFVSVAPTAVLADGYPEKPIRIIVPADVGGSVDALTRQLAPFWEKTLGTQIVIENRPGAGGITGVRRFLDQPADGYTIVVCTLDHFAATMQKTGTVKSTDIDLINFQQFSPTTWFVLDKSRFKTLEDVFNEAKQKPDTITWGTPPTDNTLLSVAVASHQWGVSLRYVPQESGAQTDTAILGNQIDIKVGTAGDIDEVAGVRALAVASDKRVPFLPDTPTFNEIATKLGLPPMPSLGAGRLLAVSAALKEKYPDRYKKIIESYKAAFNDPGYQKVLQTSGQKKSTQFNEPDVATENFRQLIDGTNKLQAQYAAK